MLVDLHVHSTYSDSTNSPEQIARLAFKKGINLISVCDHNNVCAYPYVKKACDQFNILSISGVEIDVLGLNNVNLHVLGYNIDNTNKKLKELLSYTDDILEQLSVDLISNMSNDYKELSVTEYASFTRDKKHGGWKGIDYLKSKGFNSSYPQCMKYYKNYSVSQKANYVNIKEVIKIIHDAGGVSVLAHPIDRLGKDKEYLSCYIKDLKSIGLDGVECFYPSHTKHLTDFLINLCEEIDINTTAGCDDHGKFARYIHGITYEMGIIKVHINDLNLSKIIKKEY